MRPIRAIGTILLVAATLGIVGYLTYITEPALAPGVTPAPGTTVPPPTTFPAGSASCAAFDSWAWAQSVFETDSAGLAASLDPDGNSLACEDLPVHGFAPALWTGEIPVDTIPATLVRVVDGDTLVVTINGEQDTVRMKGMDAPEIAHSGFITTPPACGGQESTAFLRTILEASDGGSLSLQTESALRDRYGRRLAYVWITVDGRPTLVNEAMVRSGWASAGTYASDRIYRDRFDAAQAFSTAHVLGVPLICGDFGLPVDATPPPGVVAEARKVQPDQGQFDDIAP